MGLFDFFKKKETKEKIIEQKETAQKDIIEEYHSLSYFERIPINNLEEYYSANLKLNNRNITINLNFENKIIEKNKVELIETFLKNIEDFDKKNKIYIEKDFKEKNGEALDYINFYLEEFDVTELETIIGLNDSNTPKSIQLLNKLNLINIGLYPDGKYGVSYFATFDYSIDIDGEPSNQLLVVNTDKKGNLDHITWES